MTIDYDVVIIGGSLAGRYAALAATKWHAKVALVEPQINYGFIYHHTLSEIANRLQSLNDADGFGIRTNHADIAEKCHISIAWQEAMLYANGVAANIQELNSPATLAALGVDVIFGRGEFQPTPHLAFAIYDNDEKSAHSPNHQVFRLLRGRTYLLASGSRPAIPNIEGLQATGYITLANIWQSLKKPTLPQNWVIIGGVPQSLEIAQTLVRLGCTVTLVIKHSQILPNIDPEIAQLLQAQLEVDGVQILTQTAVTQVKQIDDKKWLQAGDKAIETDEILVATGQQPNFASLNLAAAGVKWYQHRLVVNDKLQTTNKRIYACGDVIGGYDLTNIANYEARIALNNALFFPRLEVNYQHIPWGIFTNPMLAQVGLTETQTKRKFRDDEFLVLRQYFKSLTAAQINSDTTGICKLIVLRNGKILGATILGQSAGELINLIALAINQKIKIKDLANLAPIYPNFSEIITQTAQEYQQRLNNHPDVQDRLEGFFHFRRNWNL
ncbi:NAD(P)/FAD-dependent oxidoreductase [Nostoc sp. LEGE 06077]|uniref:dihydrolipoyl dehydrogenase family protein n=1 Tax=Nostoc sp. LEGE 06077 TaxID=915325 RepID=UPI00188066D7|nr:NAD(P)/FAD-dependent oxidoreductase [Nostoc sp. LEGE 06077]MBE9207031.1 NAD(P)/FAD-dependent oxidoreductase [Nostoc sp. LEGE 06077]